MRYSYPDAKVLFIADMAIHDDSRYEYKWDINYTEKDIETVYGYKIYYSFKELGVKDIKLTVTDKVLGLTSVYNNKMYIRQRTFLNAGRLVGSELNTDDFSFDLLRNGLYGEGLQSFLGDMINIYENYPGLAVFNLDYIGSASLVNKAFNCYVYYVSNGQKIYLNGFSTFSYDENGNINQLIDPDDFTLELNLNANYNSLTVDLYLDIYEAVGEQELELINGLGVYLGFMDVRNPINVFMLTTDPNTYGIALDFSVLYSWEGRASFSFYIAAISDVPFDNTPWPHATISKTYPAEETTNVFDVLDDDLTLDLSYNSSYFYFVHSIVSTSVLNSSVPVGKSFVNYELTGYKGVFTGSWNVSPQINIIQLSRNLVSTPYEADITFTTANVHQVFQFAKEIGKKVRVVISGLPSKSVWWHYAMDCVPVSESGLEYATLNDRYDSLSITKDFTEEADNTNELAIVINSTNLYPSYTCHLSITQV